MGEFSIWHLMIVLIIVLVFFGPSRLPNLGNSLGKAIRGFKDGLKGVVDEPTEKEAQAAREQLATSNKTETIQTDKSKDTTKS